MTQRLGRIVRIIVMLQAGLRCNALRIAAESGVHRRTVFRDFAALRSLGFPISFDVATGCYYLPRGSESPSDKGMAEFLSLFQNDTSVKLIELAREDSTQVGTDRSSQVNQSAWQDLVASEKLFPEILAQLIAAVQSQHPIVLALGTAHGRQVTLRLKHVSFSEIGWLVQGVSATGETVQLAVEAIAGCVEADAVGDPSRPSHQ